MCLILDLLGIHSEGLNTPAIVKRLKTRNVEQSMLLMTPLK